MFDAGTAPILNTRYKGKQMPLTKQPGPMGRAINIRKLISEGRAPRQAIAISYSVQGEKKKKKK